MAHKYSDNDAYSLETQHAMVTDIIVIIVKVAEGGKVEEICVYSQNNETKRH
jgi:hypothetical protein